MAKVRRMIKKETMLSLGVICLVSLITALGLLYMTLGLEHLLSYVQSPSPYRNDRILFYQEGCSHCETVDAFLENKSIQLVRLNVADNNYSNLLADKMQICGLEYDQVGVPFLWDPGSQRCIMGDVEIIAFLKKSL